jgi:flavodoxin
MNIRSYNMKSEIIYYSRSGNTKKVADAIAQALGKASKVITPDLLLDDVDILFLGAGAYANKVEKQVTEFIKTLNNHKVKNVALFGTYGWHKNFLDYMRNLLMTQGINVINETFSCKGRLFFFIYRRHPDAQDLSQAQEFARVVYGK